MPSGEDVADLLIVGAGFGGLGAAVEAALAGARVTLVEAMRYPGGCASTFTKDGHRFEAGATLFSGFGEGQLFRRWMDALELPVTWEAASPTIRFRSPATAFDVPTDREAFLQTLKALPDAPTEGIDAFFRLQGRVAETLWPVFDAPERLPPLSWSGTRWHARRALAYPTLLPVMNRSLLDVLRRFQLDAWRPLRDWCDALCQISVQTDSATAEAPFALCTLDYPFRGTGHIEGGIGRLAESLVQALRDRGVDVRMPSRVRRLEPVDGGWSVHLRGGTVLARRVLVNSTPHGLARLLGEPVDPRLTRAVESGWGAAMLYGRVRDDGRLAPHAHHLQAIVEDGPLHSGNHVFCSLSAVHQGMRTATVSTHVPMNETTSGEAQGSRVAAIQASMQEGLARRWPELTLEPLFTASPRTFARFTGRPHGYVGGVPRRVGLQNYRGLFPRPVRSGLWMVGDSVFPGQSTLATAVGGARTARAALG